MAAETITGEVARTPKAEKAGRDPDSGSKKAATKSKASRATRAKKKSTPSPAAPSTVSLEASARALALPRELGGLLCIAGALGLFLAVVSFTPADLTGLHPVQNLIGPFGARIADFLLTVFGLGVLCFDLLLWYLGAMTLLGRRPQWRLTESVGQVLFVLSGTVLAHLSLSEYTFFSRSAGGFVGELCAEVCRGAFGTVGAYIIAVCLLIASLLCVTAMSLSAIAQAVAASWHKLCAWVVHQWRVWRTYRARYAQARAALEGVGGQQILSIEQHAAHAAAKAALPLGKEAYEFDQTFEEKVETKLFRRLGKMLGTAPPPASDTQGPDPLKEPAPPAPGVARAPTPKKSAPNYPSLAAPEAEAWTLGSGPGALALRAEPTGVDEVTGHTHHVIEADILAEEGGEAEEALTPLSQSAEGDDFGPRIVESSAKDRAQRIKALLEQDDEKGVLFKPESRGDFELPKISFLNYESDNEDAVDIEQLRQMAAQIEQTLRDFKVEGQIRDICPGPVITVFEFSPAAGVKISKIANLSDDLAMALSALSVRIVAPIPGKGVVGIEVPNPKREIVYMKEIIADDVFYENKKMILPMGLGKDTAGNPVVTDLARMPHLLVAGATGSGKSVAVNTMITSLLYRNSPDDVRLIMVDPKMLEFSIYADIPHLLLPVVTDPKQATVALNWAVQEMERRYQRLADLNVRNIKGYNTKVEKLTDQAQSDMEGGLEDSPAILALGINAKGEPEHKHLPYIVVIIDEFADLMMTASKDVETAVARLAQKARAAGIHLILATQRPSTDVITGLIKANFPTRIALRVTSKTDSRVILDSNGAENLLGNGDMLFVPPGTSHVQRVHGAYVSEHEIEHIVKHLKAQRPPEYNEQILVEEDEEGAADLEEMERDEHYEDAVRLVVESRQASISMIQRKLRVGYNRSARMVEMMEREGIVSPADSCKPREVMVDVSPY